MCTYSSAIKGLWLWQSWKWRHLSCSFVPFHLFVVLLTVCLLVCLQLATVYLHSSNTSIFMMEAGHSTWRCVCVCVCVQDLIGLWSEGILLTESQVEREQGSHCSEHCAFFPLFPCSLLPHAAGGTRLLFIRLNSVWSGANSTHIPRIDFKDHRLRNMYLAVLFRMGRGGVQGQYGLMAIQILVCQLFYCSIKTVGYYRLICNYFSLMWKRNDKWKSRTVLQKLFKSQTSIKQSYLPALQAFVALCKVFYYHQQCNWTVVVEGQRTRREKGSGFEI